MGKKKQKIILPPDLPPEVPDDDIEFSEEDEQFINQNSNYADLISKIDTHSLTKHVSRVADDVHDGTLELLYEKKLRKKLENKEQEGNMLEVDPVDALPLKTLDGKLYYRTVAKEPKEEPQDEESMSKDPSLVKPTKAEKHSKAKKLRKEAKKHIKEEQTREEVQQTPQEEVLDEVKKDLTAEEANEKKKYKFAELGTTLLADPESNIKHLKEMLEISKDSDSSIVILGLKSLLAVFKDIIPGYRIRLPTEKEQEMKVSKVVKKTRFYEYTLLSAYKAYVQKLVSLQQQTVYQQVATRCLCTLLAEVPHFNYRESLLAAVVKDISSQDDVIRKLCCTSVKTLFTDEGKHGGEATVEAVKRIADLVKINNCQLHPDSLEVFLSLSFDEDLGKPERSDMDKKAKYKKFKKRKGSDEPNQDNDWKKTKKETMSKTREEVNADYKALSSDQDPQERRKKQSKTLSAVFQTFFRVLKHTVEQQSKASSVHGAFGSHPLLAPCLDGIGKFSHLIDLDFMADLMHCLRKLAGNGSKLGDSPGNSSCQLTVSERLRCCIVAFKVMRSNLDALNVDLQEFFIQLYNLILEYQPARDDGDLLVEAMKIMLCDERQQDMQRAAAFIKRLSTFSLCFRTAESMAALVTVKHLLQKNAKCRNLLENDAGGGSVAGAIAKFQPHMTDPNLSGALASVLWELNLLMKHYHPSVSSIASTLSTMNASTNQIYHSQSSPQQAYVEFLRENESFTAPSNVKRVANKRKGTDCTPVKESEINLSSEIDENAVRIKLAEHFSLLRDIQENERLRSELDRSKTSLDLYEKYRKEKKRKTR